MSTPEIRVSTSGFLAVQPLLYATPEAIAGEMLQNAQRAGASKVSVDIKANGFTVTDDGHGCDDFQKILTIAESGWEDKSTNPFGMGFWSLSAFADDIQVSSRGQRLDIHLELVREGRGGLVMSEVPDQEGFQVSAWDCDGNTPLTFDEAAFRNAFKRMAQFLPIEVVVDGIAVPQFSEKKFLDLPWAKKVTLKGGDILYLRPMPSEWNFARMEVPGEADRVAAVYQGRPVGSSAGMDFLCGALLAVRDLDLRAPDRSEFIWNEKWKSVRMEIERHRHALFLDIMKNGTDEDHDRFAEPLARLLTVKEIAQHVRFAFVSGREDSETAVTEERLPEPPPSSEQDRALTNWTVTEGLASESPLPTRSLDPGALEALPAPIDPAEVEEAVADAFRPKDRPSEPQPPRRAGVNYRPGIKLTAERLYYSRNTEDDMGAIQKAHRFGARVVQVRNALERRLAEAAPNMIPVREVTAHFRKSVSARVKGRLNSKEVRAARVLQGLLADTGIAGQAALADITVTEFLVGGVESFEREHPALVTRSGDTLYLDRELVGRLIEESGLPQNRAQMGLADVGFLALCSPHLSSFLVEDNDGETRARNGAEVMMDHLTRLISMRE